MPNAGPQSSTGFEIESSLAPASVRATLRDIDAMLARLDVGIAAERKAMDELLDRIRRSA